MRKLKIRLSNAVVTFSGHSRLVIWMSESRVMCWKLIRSEKGAGLTLLRSHLLSQTWAGTFSATYATADAMY